MFSERGTVIFDFVLRSRISGEGGCRAEAMGGSRALRDSNQSRGQNLAEAVLTIDGGTRSREIPKGSRHVRNSVLSLDVKLRQSKSKRDTKLRYVDIARGVSFDHVYSQAFGDVSHQT